MKKTMLTYVNSENKPSQGKKASSSNHNSICHQMSIKIHTLMGRHERMSMKMSRRRGMRKHMDMGKHAFYLFTLTILLIGSLSVSTRAVLSPRAVLEDIADRQNLGHESYLLEIEAISHQDDEKEQATIKVYLGQEDRQLVTFEEPERMQDDCYLVVGYNTWIFQQGMRRPLRISAQQKLFGEAGIAETVGLDYLKDYRIEEVLQTQSEYELSLVALDKRTAYRRVTLWISRQNPNIKKAALMAVNGQPLKELTFSNYRSVNGHELGEIMVKNLLLKKNHYTTLKFLRVLEKKIPDAAFQPMMMGKIKQFINENGQE